MKAIKAKSLFESVKGSDGLAPTPPEEEGESMEDDPNDTPEEKADKRKFKKARPPVQITGDN